MSKRKKVRHSKIRNTGLLFEFLTRQVTADVLNKTQKSKAMKIIKKRFKILNMESFDLILDLQSKIRNSLILRIIPHKKFISSDFNVSWLDNEKII